MANYELLHVTDAAGVLRVPYIISYILLDMMFFILRKCIKYTYRNILKKDIRLLCLFIASVFKNFRIDYNIN